MCGDSIPAARKGEATQSCWEEEADSMGDGVPRRSPHLSRCFGETIVLGLEVLKCHLPARA